MELPKTYESISVSIPSWLLQLIEHECEEQTLDRSKFIQLAIKKYLLLKLESPRLWREIYLMKTKE